MRIFELLIRLLLGPSDSPSQSVNSFPPGTTKSRSSKRREPKPVDAARFAPLSRDEVVRKAKGIRFAWGAFFGRRDIIPPTSDFRTEIIDRGMVGQGIITPDELAQLHTIGDEMIRLRPDLGGAHLAATEAVERSKQEGEELKKLKQSEAAERKRKHAEAVAQRHATDIVFLGRGVSRGLADRRSHLEKLEERGLPALSTPSDVAVAMDIGIPKLRWLAFHHPATTVTHYTNFRVPKKSGGERTLSAPKPAIRECQEWILTNVLAKLDLHPAAHGFVPGRSTLTNAQPHVGRAILINTDIEEFFPSITFARVQGLFVSFGYSPAVATVLALLCTESPRRAVSYAGERLHVAAGPRSLPQGACTSPALSNLVARRLDARLQGIADKLGWNYTRYADDCTFSAGDDTARQVGYLLARIRHITSDEGFEVNEKKTRVLRRNARQAVTGITVNDRPTLPRSLRRRLRSILHQAKRGGLAAQNREDHPNFKSWLEGMIAYASMVQPEVGESLRRQYEELK